MIIILYNFMILPLVNVILVMKVFLKTIPFIFVVAFLLISSLSSWAGGKSHAQEKEKDIMLAIRDYSAESNIIRYNTFNVSAVDVKNRILNGEPVHFVYREGEEEKRTIESSLIIEALKNGVEEIDIEGAVITGNLNFVIEETLVDINKVNLEANEIKKLKNLGIEKVYFISPSIQIVNCQIEGMVSVYPNARGVNKEIVIFEKNISFLNSTFLKIVSFHYAIFNRETEFCYAEFNGEVIFYNTSFKRRTSFRGASFKRQAYFESNLPILWTKTFEKEADFNGAKFENTANFYNTNFNSETDFDNIRFDSIAGFTCAKFVGEAKFGNAGFNNKADFSNASFYSKADFNNASFNKKADFNNTGFYGEADFSNTSFKEAIFDNVMFSKLVDLRLAKYSELYISWSNLKERLDDISLQNDIVSWQGVYLKLIKNFENIGDVVSADSAYYYYRCTKYVFCSDWWGKLKWWLGYLFMGLTCGYGVIPWRTIATGGIIIFFFTLAYYSKKDSLEYKKEEQARASGNQVNQNFWHCLYFSVVTFTTLGYGDFRPLGKFRYLAMTEGILGWLTMALFLVTLANVWLR